MGMWDHLIYPDNKNRATRASELGDDCGALAYQAASQYEKIEESLKSASEELVNAYERFNQGEVAFTKYKPEQDVLAIEIADLFLAIFVNFKTQKAAMVAARFLLLKLGRIGEAALVELIGLPKWLNIIKVMGGMAAAAALTVALDAVVEAVEGELHRKHLREAIHSLIGPRVELKKHAMINQKTLDTLTATINAYKAITSVPGITYTKDQIDGIAANLIGQMEKDVESLTDDVVLKELADQDAYRSSWTKEDHQ